MQKIKVPERYNYIEAYLTFRCNLDCSYCVNKVGGLDKGREELTGLEWKDIFNRLQTPLQITLGGGEPTIHKDFYQIIKKTNHKFDLLTNLQFDIDNFIKNVDPNKFSTSHINFYHPIRASYHQQMDKQDTIKRAKKLKDKGFNVGLFGVMHPECINDNMEVAFLSMREGVPFYNKDFLGKFDGKFFGYFKYPRGVDNTPKKAECRTRELLLAPDGLVFRCHTDLYNNKNSIGDIRNKDFKINDVFRSCSDYGLCNPCDVKGKTNRYLKGIDCQVEIKEI